MKILEYFYEFKPEILKFNNRKIELENGKILIYGAQNSGKSYILIDKISTLKQDEFLYIDFSDFRFDSGEIFENLAQFLKQNPQIKTLAFDNLNEISAQNLEILEAISPKFENFFITSRQNFKISNFKSLKISPLSFEEFISFDKKRTEINAIISAFLQLGNGVKNSFLQNYQIAQSEQKLLKSHFPDFEIEILKLCVAHQNFSANRIYTALKEKMKISKDSVYSAISRFENENLINFVPKFADEKAVKKLYFSHFNLPECLSFKKDFHKKFANALFCEILAAFKDGIFYTKELDFFIPKQKLGILIIPFSASDIVFLRFRKLLPVLKALKIVRLSVISMANSGVSEIEGIKCEVIPFWQFSLSL